jgi:hypothetical protein
VRDKWSGVQSDGELEVTFGDSFNLSVRCGQRVYSKRAMREQRCKETRGRDENIRSVTVMEGWKIEASLPRAGDAQKGREKCQVCDPFEIGGLVREDVVSVAILCLGGRH